MFEFQSLLVLIQYVTQQLQAKITNKYNFIGGSYLIPVKSNNTTFILSKLDFTARWNLGQRYNLGTNKVFIILSILVNPKVNDCDDVEKALMNPV